MSKHHNIFIMFLQGNTRLFLFYLNALHDYILSNVEGFKDSQWSLSLDQNIIKQ
jgi:hypothetical protein